MKMDKHELETFKIDQMFIGSSKEELIALGEKRREKYPISAISTFQPVDRDVVQLIKLTEEKMIPELLDMRHQRMMQNPFSYFRATAGIMERDLRQFPDNQSHIPVIICGDSHLTNFGFFASPERQLLFGLNDFDEARIGNWEFDLKRLLTSIALTGRINGYGQETIDQILQTAVHSYRRGIKYANTFSLLDLFNLSYNVEDLMKEMTDNEQMQRVLMKVANRAPKNNSDAVVKKLTEETPEGLRFKDNPPRARHLSEKQYKSLLEGLNEYQTNASEDVRVLLINYQVTDIIRYSVGVGSWGTRCYLVLLTGKDGSHLILQIKEALPLRYNLSALTVTESQEKGEGEGKRIITAQKVLQTYYDLFLGSMEADGRAFYVRQFRDMKDSIDPLKLDLESFSAYSNICAFILAIAHYQSPTAPMIYGYVHKQKDLDTGLAQWATAYADQMEKDYQAFGKYLLGDDDDD
ncbi:DUF2252 domain-containing protein [Lactobacillus sp.]|uniref:DUF2252 domain-containing protein n=1 Tax=Lactobacillus sp. TaxID=1591 RepID=UPI003EF57F40